MTGYKQNTNNSCTLFRQAGNHSRDHTYSNLLRNGTEIWKEFPTSFRSCYHMDFSIQAFIFAHVYMQMYFVGLECAMRIRYRCLIKPKKTGKMRAACVVYRHYIGISWARNTKEQSAAVQEKGTTPWWSTTHQLRARSMHQSRGETRNVISEDHMSTFMRK